MSPGNPHGVSPKSNLPLVLRGNLRPGRRALIWGRADRGIPLGCSNRGCSRRCGRRYAEVITATARSRCTFVDTSLHPLSRTAPFGGAGRGGDHRVPEPSRDATPDSGRNSESGAEGAAVSLQSGAQARAHLDGRHQACPRRAQRLAPGSRTRPCARGDRALTSNLRWTVGEATRRSPARPAANPRDNHRRRSCAGLL